MYSATFTFAKRHFDDDFHAIDHVIAEIAKSIPGYLGEESWESAATGYFSNVYYWDTLEALRQLVEHPAHKAAKARQAEWLLGYQVVIAQVLRTDGDAGISHPLARFCAGQLKNCTDTTLRDSSSHHDKPTSNQS